MQQQQHYDVIIVGGRPAGASLAVRLGRYNFKVLVVDKATFPSRPSVPSTPLLYDGTMKMLDELGIPESAYAAISTKADRFHLQMADHFSTVMEMSPLVKGHLKRDYIYSFERQPFDQILWENLQHYPTVTARDDFAVTDVLRDENGKVTGIVGHQDKKQPETYTADLVVGADGRFSRFAQMVGAEVTQELNEAQSSVYYATWEGLTPIDGSDQHNTMRIFSDLHGVAVLTMPVPGNRHLVNLYMRAGMEAEKGERSMEAFYVDQLKRFPHVWKQVENAQMTTPIYGIKGVGNGYRKAGGNGWALIGDALHYKDPIDGQGIHDAMLSSKLLSEAVYAWKCSDTSWTTAVQHYEKCFLEETLPMLRETTARIKRELYDEPPTLIVKTVLRWLLQNPAYQQRYLMYLGRAIPPTGWMSGKLMLQSVLRGLWKDITRQAA